MSIIATCLYSCGGRPESKVYASCHHVVLQVSPLLTVKVMLLLEKHPEIVANQRWPQYLFLGGNGLENAAGMMSTSPVLRGLLAQPPPAAGK